MPTQVSSKVALAAPPGSSGNAGSVGNPLGSP